MFYEIKYFGAYIDVLLFKKRLKWLDIRHWSSDDFTPRPTAMDTLLFVLPINRINKNTDKMHHHSLM